MSLRKMRQGLSQTAAVTASAALALGAMLAVTGVATAATSHRAPAKKVKIGDFTKFEQAQLKAIKSESAGGSTNPVLLLGFITLGQTMNPLSYLGGPYTVQNNFGVSSSATVTGVGAPAAYSMTMSTTGQAASGLTAGYVVPSGEVVTFPKGFEMNPAVVKNAIPYADISDPSAAKKKPIGELTLTSPLAPLAGGSGTHASGQVYLAKSSSTAGVKLYMELYFGGDYVIGKLSGIAFPMTVTFSEPYVSLLSLGNQPLPLSALTVSFPAATSPFVFTSCSKIGKPKATVTDALAPYASNPILSTVDGHLSSGESTGPISVPSSKATVTNDCKGTSKKS